MRTLNLLDVGIVFNRCENSEIYLDSLVRNFNQALFSDQILDGGYVEGYYL
jgi:hypothetical protein